MVNGEWISIENGIQDLDQCMILGGVSFCAVLGAARLGHLGLHLLDDRVILKLELLALTAFGSWCKEIKHRQVGLQRQEAVVALLAESTAKQLRDLAKAGACGHIQQAAGQSILDVDINDLVMEQFPALRGVLLTLDKVGKIKRRLEVGQASRSNSNLQRAPVSP